MIFFENPILHLVPIAVEQVGGTAAAAPVEKSIPVAAVPAPKKEEAAPVLRPTSHNPAYDDKKKSD